VQQFDAIIIGAGHNGLVCAAYLAKKGQRVLILEAAERAGGLLRSREFHPGFHCPVAHSTSHFPDKIIRDLGLHDLGLSLPQKPLPTIALDVDQAHVIIHDEELGGVSDADQDSYRKFQKLLHRQADTLKPFWLKTIPGIGNHKLTALGLFAHIGFSIRRLGKRDMGEFLRMASLPMRDLMDEYFDDPKLQAALAWDGLIGSKLAPRSPNGAMIALLYRMGGSYRGSHAIPKDGMAGLLNALSAAAIKAGAELRCDSVVEKIVIDASEDGLKASGVQLADGQVIKADRVVSATDPRRTFLDLVGVEHLDIGFTNRIRRLRCDGYVAKLHLALDGLPEFPGVREAGSRMIAAPDLDAIEFAYDHAKYGELPDQPVMEWLLPSLADPALAPTGKQVLSAHLMYVPYEFEGGWNAEAKAKLFERAVDVIARYAPGIRQQIIHGELLTPLDLEQQYRVTGGHWHHAELSMDQMLMMRPTYQAAQYRTPIPGVYLCGAGSHPGGDICGAAGHNAAQAILHE
jgi:phytoene dehydrogenase-like protein